MLRLACFSSRSFSLMSVFPIIWTWMGDGRAVTENYTSSTPSKREGKWFWPWKQWLVTSPVFRPHMTLKYKFDGNSTLYFCNGPKYLCHLWVLLSAPCGEIQTILVCRSLYTFPAVFLYLGIIMIIWYNNTYIISAYNTYIHCVPFISKHTRSATGPCVHADSS